MLLETMMFAQLPSYLKVLITLKIPSCCFLVGSCSDPSEECFGIWRARVEQGFNTREGNFTLSTVFGCKQFAAEGLAANSALALAGTPGGFNGTEKKWELVHRLFLLTVNVGIA